MKFTSGQKVCLLSNSFNFVRCDGVLADPPRFDKIYTFLDYVPSLFHGRVIFWLKGFPKGMMFFEETFDVVPSIEQVAKDLDGAVNLDGKFQ
jgi:hypothetical protein